MSQVISCVQEKGGAGKTTLLMALTSLMVEDGAKIAIVDTDPQRHFEEWAKKGKTDLDWVYVEDDEKLVPTIRKLKEATPKYDAICIDTAGFKSAMSIYAIHASDLVLIPTKANEADAKGAIRTYSHVQNVADSLDRKINSSVVLVDVDTNSNITKSIVEALTAQKVPLAQTYCAHRTGFKEMGSLGMLPAGSARTSAQGWLAEMQEKDMLEYYGKEGQWLNSTST